MQRSPRCRVVWALACLTACAAPPTDPASAPSERRVSAGEPTPAAAASVPAPLLDAAAALVDAPPARWPSACAAWQELAEPTAPDTAARALVDALSRQPTGDGVQPALALLGNLDVPASREALLALATATDPRPAHAADAALALGRGRPDPALVEPLQRLVDDRDAPRTLRTGAAATLLDWHQPQLAAPFLHAVLVGGTPQGQPTMQRFGLADDTRWALERTIAIAAIDRWAGRPGAYDLDPDLPWTLLAERAERFLTDALRTGR